MIIKETYELTIRTKSTCPMRDKVLDVLDKVADGDIAPVKVVIGAKKEDGKVALYIDNDAPENFFGIVKSCAKDNEEISEPLMEQLIVDKNYEIQLRSRAKFTISGQLHILKADGSASGKSDESISEDLRAVIEEKIAEGIVDREDMDERIKVFKTNHVDDFLMMRIIKGYRKYKKDVRKPNCIYVDPFLESSLKEGEEPIISEILRSCVSRNGIIFEGEKSVGKNVCATTIAWLMGMPERLFTCSRQMTTSTLYGEKTTDNSALEALNAADIEKLALARLGVERQNARVELETFKNAAKYDVIKAKAASTNIIIEDSELVDWLQDGGILILNEMNLCEPNLLASFLNPILDGTGYLTIQGRGEVKVNPDCVLIGTQNADYAGTEEQNEATMSRLACERFRQPGSVAELLVNSVQAKLNEDGFTKAGVDSKYIAQADKFYGAIRHAVEEGLITNAALNIRGFVRALAAVFESDGHCRLKRQLELNVVNTCPLMEAEVLRGVLQNVVTL